MFAALLLIIYNVTQQLGMSVGEAVRAVAADEHSRMFVWDDWVSTQNFWKQLLSGAFIAIVMTGLDQDMMQKTSRANRYVRLKRMCVRMVSPSCQPTCCSWLWACCL